MFKNSNNMLSLKSFFRSRMIIALVSVAGCKHDAPSVTYHGKVIWNGACAGYTIQVANAPFPPHLDGSWRNPLNDSTYTNVFNAGSPGALLKAGVGLGDSISFTIGNPPSSGVVYNTCAILYPPPVAYNYLTSVQKIN